jgi:hypothetical protein
MATATIDTTETDRGDRQGGQPPVKGRYRPESWLDRVPRDAWATVVRLRRQVLPHAAAGTVAAGGYAAQAVVAHGAAPGQVALVAAAAGFPAAGIAVAAVWRRGHDWFRRALLGGLAGAAWLTTAPFGVGPEHVTALVACEYTLAAGWWQANRLGYPTADGEEPAEELDAPERALTRAEEIILDWKTFVASPGGPLPGSQLLAPETTRHTIAFTLLLGRGKQSLAAAVAALDRIASGLDLEVDEIIVESHPLFKSAARCRFQVVTDSPISGDVVFDGPRRAGGAGFGLLELGPWADGSGEAAYRLYTPGSMWSGVIIGGTGIGKSRVVENIVISALSGGDTEYWYLDPARGGSSPTLFEHADWAGAVPGADAMLDAALEILDARAEENAFEGWTGFTASPQRPGILLVVEECHRIFSHRAEDWARIAREGRKVGLALLCVSQYSGIVTFGGDEALRSSVMEGNVIALRSTSNTNGQLMPGLSVDPKTLPKIPGYAYMQGDDIAGTRTAPFRNRDTDPTSDGGVAMYWLVQQPRPGLDVLSATATLSAGTAYRDRNVSDETGRTASRSRIEALRGGHLPVARMGGQADTAAAPAADTAGGVAGFGVVVPFPPALRPTAEAQTAATPAVPGLPPSPDTQPQDPGLAGSRKAVYDAVAAGASRPTEVEETTGLSHRHVADLLKDLVASGYLLQPRYGRYERAA